MEYKMTNTPLIYGVITGFSLVIFILILYMGGVSWFMSPVAFLQYVILIILAVLCGLKERKLQGDHMSFGHALKVLFLFFVISGIIATLFTYLLMNFIDVPFRQALSQQAAEATEKFMEKMGLPQESIDKAVGDLLSGKSYSIGNMLLSYAIGLIGWFLVSLIIAAIIKKQRPPFDNFANQPNQ
jgi:hypothetical protein